MEVFSLDQAALARHLFQGAASQRHYVLIDHELGRWRTASQESERPVWRERGLVRAGESDSVRLSIYRHRNMRADKLIGSYQLRLSDTLPSNAYAVASIYKDDKLVARVRYCRTSISAPTGDICERRLVATQNVTRFMCKSCSGARQCQECTILQRQVLKTAPAWPALPLQSLSWMERASVWPLRRWSMSRQLHESVQTGANMIASSVSRRDTSLAVLDITPMKRRLLWRASRAKLRSQSSIARRSVGTVRVCIHAGDDLQESHPMVCVMLAGAELGRTNAMPSGGTVHFPEDSSTFEGPILDINSDLAFLVTDEVSAGIVGRALGGDRITGRAVLPLAHLMHQTLSRKCGTAALFCRTPVHKAVEMRLLLFPAASRESKSPPWRYGAAEGGLKRSAWVGLASLRVEVELLIDVTWLSTYMEPARYVDVSRPEPQLQLPGVQDIAAWQSLASSITASVRSMQALIRRPPIVAEVPMLVFYVLFCSFAELFHWPLFFILVLAINGAADALSSRAEVPQVWTHEFSSEKPTLRRSKTFSGVKMTLENSYNSVSRIDTALAQASVALAKARNVYRWADLTASFIIHAVIIFWMLIACVVLYVVPTRLLGIVVGLLLYFRVFVGKIVRFAGRLVEEDDVEEIDADSPLLQREDTMTRNPWLRNVVEYAQRMGVAKRMKKNREKWAGLWSRLPDEEEWVHRQICEMQIAELRETSIDVSGASLPV